MLVKVIYMALYMSAFSCNVFLRIMCDSTFHISIHVDMNPSLEIDKVNAAPWLIQI